MICSRQADSSSSVCCWSSTTRLTRSAHVSNVLAPASRSPSIRSSSVSSAASAAAAPACAASAAASSDASCASSRSRLLLLTTANSHSRPSAERTRAKRSSAGSATATRGTSSTKPITHTPRRSASWAENNALLEDGSFVVDIDQVPLAREQPRKPRLIDPTATEHNLAEPLASSHPLGDRQPQLLLRRNPRPREQGRQR